MTDPTGAILIAGGTSGAGKSTVAAALCRSFARRGLSVAPFKAQNMSNHAAVTADGGEIGRAQAMQADAACVVADRRMNPILLKPSSEQKSHLVILGEERTTTDAGSYGAVTDELKPVVLDALTSLRGDHDLVVAEGAGGAAEVNLLDRDVVNLPLAHAAGLPVIVVVDIERGGAFAAAYGTIDLVPRHLRETIVGVIFNRFHGDPTMLDPGIADLERRTGVPVLGVLPSLGPAPLLGVEDSLDVTTGSRRAPSSTKPVRVAAVLLPHLANPSDLDPFSIEPDVVVRWVSNPGELADADLIVVPGTRATVRDLRWMESNGFVEAIEWAATESATVVGICGGYQLLGRVIDDPIESASGRVDGMGLLDAATLFQHPKIVTRSHGWSGDRPVCGYQIRFGRPASDASWLEIDGEPEGSVAPSMPVFGTSLHGIFDADRFRTALLTDVAKTRDRTYRSAPTGFADALETQHDELADWIESNLDIHRILEFAATARPPTEVPGW